MSGNDRTAALAIIGILATLSLIISALALSKAFQPPRMTLAQQFRLVDYFDRERARLSFTQDDAVLLQIFDTGYNNTITITFDAETGAVYLTDSAGNRRLLDLPPPQGSP